MGDPMTFAMKYSVTPRYLTAPSKRRSGIKMTDAVRFIVAHDTGNEGSTAVNNVAYYERSRDEMSASAHIFVDDKIILECVPVLTAPPEKAWHVRYNVPIDDKLYGIQANDAAIGVEYCFGANIDADEAYRRYVWVIAYACYKYNLDPAISVTGHFILDPARKTDPVTGLARSRRTYDQLLADIVTEYVECTKNGGQFIISGMRDEMGTVTATVKLNLRQGAPSTRAPVAGLILPGTTVSYVGVTDEGDRVDGISRWYRDVNGHFFWAGGAMTAVA